MKLSDDAKKCLIALDEKIESTKKEKKEKEPKKYPSYSMQEMVRKISILQNSFRPNQESFGYQFTAMAENPNDGKMYEASITM